MAKQKILIDAFGADFPDQIINGIKMRENLRLKNRPASTLRGNNK
jgi:hypothetical protein